jgi:hypothetical protein
VKGQAGTLGEEIFLAVSLALRPPHLAPNAAATRASSFGLFDKALAKSAEEHVDPLDV